MKNVRETVDKVYGNYPESILQFGEGNFLRGFADWMVDLANASGKYQGSIVLCQPIAQGLGDIIAAQDGVYTLVMRGREEGEAKEKVATITSVSRCINPYEDFDALLQLAHSPALRVVISNTTEAGIAYHAGDRLEDRPPASYPAKLTVFLYERFKAFGDTPESELLILPVELIDDNGGHLARIVTRYAEEWQLGEDFSRWIKERVHITSTLVDRIVTGYPRDEIAEFEQKLGYRDDLLVTSELFNLWVIEGKAEWASILPIHKTEANVLWVDDVTPYKMRKVRILNGAHTSTVLAAYLAGFDIVRDFMQDEVFSRYLRTMIFNEIIPTLDLPRSELESFANAVADRFNNPFIRHRLLDISLNSCSKFAARSLPSLLGYYERKNSLPPLLVFSLAAFIAFYRGKMIEGKYIGRRHDGTEYEIRDDADILSFFAAQWEKGDVSALVKDVLVKKEYWNGTDLTELPGLADAVAGNVRKIMESDDIREVIAALLRE